MTFLENEEDDTFKLAWGKDKKNAGFSGRSILSESGVDLKKFPVSIEPKVQDYNNKKIFVLEFNKDK